MRAAVLDGVWVGLGFVFALLLVWAAAHLLWALVVAVHFLFFEYDGPFQTWRRKRRNSRRS